MVLPVEKMRPFSEDMAVYGAGSNWVDVELSNQFFATGRFTLGWDHAHAEDLYAFIASLKAGDIIYLKAKGIRRLLMQGQNGKRGSVHAP